MMMLLLVNILCLSSFISVSTRENFLNEPLKNLTAFIAAVCLTVLIRTIFLFGGIDFSLFQLFQTLCSVLILYSFRQAILLWIKRFLHDDSSNKKIILAFMAGFATISFFVTQVQSSGEEVRLRLILSSDRPERFQLFYTSVPGEIFSQSKSRFALVKGGNLDERIDFILAQNTRTLRLDIGEENIPNRIQFKEIRLICGRDSVMFANGELNGKFFVNEFAADLGNGHLLVKNEDGFDPFIVFSDSFMKDYKSISSSGQGAVKIAWWVILFIAVFLVQQQWQKIYGYISVGTLFLTASLLVATIRFVRSSHRWGEWDAWAIWTQHAKFFMTSSWPSLFSGNIAWSHPDYPVLLPVLISILARSSGGLTPIIPIVVALSVLFLIIALLFYSLQPSKYLAYAGVILILIHLKFIWFSSTQYADTPLALLYLLSIVVISKSNESPGSLAFIGLISSFCLWIKDEGSIFFAILSCFMVIYYFRSPTKIGFYFLGGSVPALTFIVFKAFIAPKVGMVHNIHDEFAAKLVDADRYVIIARSFTHLLITQQQVLIASLAVVVAASIRRLNKPFMRAAIFILIIFSVIVFIASASFLLPFVVLVILLFSFKELLTRRRSLAFIPMGTLFCYLCIYVVTPHDLVWHLDTSLNRLVHQLFPTILYIALLQIPELQNAPLKTSSDAFSQTPLIQ